ncbi:uncharacterized protein C2845_PM03G08440 [Panicum miliaceum]|uniref:Uncharacterized protein n=1 Tax=Panicum miliaceum TaxID=4540 RepID=A0A3L6TA43_PANMI|nr:uncharacterized protein C2845_PM03G08440 [Panicum miliaceum]
MAKARRPPFAAAERFLGFPRGGSPGAVAPEPDGDDLPDLAEADVWYSAADSGSPCPAASRPVEAEGRTGGRAARRGVQGGLSRAFGDGPGRPVAASAPVEVPAWPSSFAVPDPEPALLFEMEMDGDDGKAGAGGWVPPHVRVRGGGRRADAQGPGHVAGARRRLEPDGLRRMTTTAINQKLGF